MPWRARKRPRTCPLTSYSSLVQPDHPDLFPAERVLWTGSPVHRPAPDKVDLFQLAFGLLALMFGTFWMSGALRGGFIFAGFGALVILIALVQSWGQVAYRHLALRRTVYTVTDQRVVVVSTVFGRRRERSEYLKDLPPPVLSVAPRGNGTITFGSEGQIVRHPTRRRSVVFERPLALYGIDNAKHVRDLIVGNRSGN